MSNLRIDLLEKQVTVLNKELTETKKDLATTQREISEVLGEMQRTMQGLAHATRIALATLDDRIAKLEPPKVEEVAGTQGVEL